MSPSLAEALTTLPNRRRPGPPCSIKTMLDAIAETDPEGYAALVVAIDDQGVPAAGLANLLTENGHHTSSFNVGRHRRRGLATGCRCPR